MDSTPEARIARVKVVAEEMLSGAFGGPVGLGDGAYLRDQETIYRFPVSNGPAGTPTSVIVKSPTQRDDSAYDPDAVEFMAQAQRLFNEWASLEFLSRVMGEDSPAPRFYAGNREVGLLAIEDLGDVGRLDELLLGDDPALSEKAMLEFAATVGRMQARTYERQDEYFEIRGALGPRPQSGASFYDRLPAAFEEACKVLDMEPEPGAIAELQQAVERLRDPGPFKAFNHGDPCPDNLLYVDSRVRLIDFEFGGCIHALNDGMYGRIHFPTCWCVNRLPDGLPQRMEASYREALAEGCPAAADDALFYQAVTDVCVNWAITTADWGPMERLLEKDGEWGISTIRQRVLLRFGIAARTIRETGYLKAIGATLEKLAGRLEKRWSGEVAEMPLYPSFR